MMDEVRATILATAATAGAILGISTAVIVLALMSVI
jgi:hypothetical protein